MALEGRRSAEHALMKELTVLRRCRSFRDPATSPSWKCPSLGSLSRKIEGEDVGHLRGETTSTKEPGKTLTRIVSVAANCSGCPDWLSNGSIITGHGVGYEDMQDSSDEEGWLEITPGETVRVEPVKKSPRNGHLMRQEGKRCQRDPFGEDLVVNASRRNLMEPVVNYMVYHDGIQSRRDLDSRIRAHMAPQLKDKLDFGRVDRYNDSSVDSSARLDNITTNRRPRSFKKGKEQQDAGTTSLKCSRQFLLNCSTKRRKDRSLSRYEGAETFSLKNESMESSFSSCSIQLPSRGNFRTRKRKSYRAKKSHLQASCKTAPKHSEGMDPGNAFNSWYQGIWRSSAFKTDEKLGEISNGYDELEISDLPFNGCEIPWHGPVNDHFQDLAGRNIFSGLSDLAGRKLARLKMFPSHPRLCRESVATTASEHSDTSLTSNSLNTNPESLPLLHEPDTPSNSGSASDQGLEEEGRADGSQISGIFSEHGSAARVSKRGGPAKEDGHCTLSKKYMPRFFHEIVGQNLVTQALSNISMTRKIAPIYIFYGPPGTGKTSCARVFAAALNCVSSRERKPCGFCSNCLAQDIGKNSVVSAVGSHGVRGIKALLHAAAWYSSYYKVLTVDECNSLSFQDWNAFLKILEEAPKNIVWILSAVSLEQLPHAVVSRYQKFLFAKIKESDVVNRLQAIAALENLDADIEALKLIAATCDGSLQAAEMTLDQLSLVGEKISMSMVCELVGMIPDDKLLDLLDIALSADTVNTVRRSKALIDSGAEPLNLISQMGALITNILAGCYKIPKERQQRNFFKKGKLSKKDMERLRQALKTLSEAEKQLRSSRNHTTWLAAAALLKFAPDQSYILQRSSQESSFTQSPVLLNDLPSMIDLESFKEKQHGSQLSFTKFSVANDADRKVGAAPKSSNMSKVPLLEAKKLSPPSSLSLQLSNGMKGSKVGVESSKVTEQNSDDCLTCMWLKLCPTELKDVWQRVLDAVHSNSLRQFLQAQGKILSLYNSKDFAVVHLEFSQREHTSRAGRSRASIAHAFQVALGFRVEIKVSLATREHKHVKEAFGNKRNDSGNLWEPKVVHVDGWTQSDEVVAEGTRHNSGTGMKLRGTHGRIPKSFEVNGAFTTHANDPENSAQRLSDILEVVVFNGERNHHECGSIKIPDEEELENAWAQQVQNSPHHSTRNAHIADKSWNATGCRSCIMRKTKDSLGFVIQQAEGSVDDYSQDLQFEHLKRAFSRKHARHRGRDYIFSGLSSTSNKIEKRSLKLESRTSGLLCWRTPKGRHVKVKQSSRRPHFFLRVIPCANS